MSRTIDAICNRLGISRNIRYREEAVEIRVTDVPESARSYLESLNSFNVQLGVAQPTQPVAQPPVDPAPEIHLPSVWERLIEDDN